MRIVGTLQEILSMVRECEYTRINDGCVNCPLLSVVGNDDGCKGMDDICEVDNGHQEDS